MILRPQKLKQKTRSDIQTQGFSLIEVMVSFTIFTLVLMFAMGAMFALITANQKAQAVKAVMNNLNFALEGMARSIRVGTSYYCSNTLALLPAPPLPSPPATRNCNNGTALGFRSSTGSHTVYQVNNNQLEVWKSGDLSFNPITAPDVIITDFKFHVAGTNRAFNNPQPIVTIVLEGTAGIKSGTQTTFSIQTTVTQRIPDSP